MNKNEFGVFCSQTGRLDTVKCPHYPIAPHFHCNCRENSNDAFFIEIKAAILKFLSNHKRFYNIAKAILSKMSKTRGVALLASKYFKSYYYYHYLLFSELNNMLLA